MNRFWKPLAFFVLAAPAWCVDAPAEADTYVLSNTANNYGTQAALSVSSNATTGVQSVGLLRLDLSALPSGLTAADVTQATLTLYLNKVSTTGVVKVCLLTSAFIETTTNWSGRPATDCSGAITMSASQSGAYAFADVTVMVQAWLSTGQNFGISLEPGSPTMSVYFDSKENSATSHPAYLSIAWRGPAGPRGMQGDPGATGATGATGPAGATGPIGATGAMGPAGATGAMGAMGPAGLPGATGATGVTGPQGPTGGLDPQTLTSLCGFAERTGALAQAPPEWNCGKIVFVTSSTSPANLGGVAGADAICGTRAAAAKIPGQFMAWISVPGVSPNSRFTRAAIPYRLVDGTTIANNYADLTDGTLLHSINLDERGTLVSGAWVWTGTWESGVGTLYHCQSWTSAASADTGAIGNTDGVGRPWSAQYQDYCNGSYRLYCFQQ